MNPMPPLSSLGRLVRSDLPEPTWSTLAYDMAALNRWPG